MPVAPRPDGEDEDAAAAAPPAQNADNEFAEWQNEHRADEGEDEVDEVSLSLYIAQTPVRMKKISLVARQQESVPKACTIGKICALHPGQQQFQ